MRRDRKKKTNLDGSVQLKDVVLGGSVQQGY